MMRIRKGDSVRVIRGKDRGREGKVIRVSRKKNQVWVEGINIYKKHLKPSARNPQGGIVEVQKPLDAFKVQVICRHCRKPTRVGFGFKGERKIRICKKCGGEL